MVHQGKDHQHFTHMHADAQTHTHAHVCMYMHAHTTHICTHGADSHIPLRSSFMYSTLILRIAKFLRTFFSNVISGLHFLHAKGNSSCPEAISRAGAARHSQGDDVRGARVVLGATGVCGEDAGAAGSYYCYCQIGFVNRIIATDYHILWHTIIFGTS